MSESSDRLYGLSSNKNPDKVQQEDHTFVAGVEVGLSVSLQMAGDVGCTEHLPTDATGHFTFVSDHVGTESVFGGKSRGTGLQWHSRWGQSSVERNNEGKKSRF